MDNYEFANETFFIPGTVGKPGNREFFIQVGDIENYICAKLEKFQLVALAESLTNVLADMPSSKPLEQEPELKPLKNYAFITDEITVGIDLSNQMIVVSLAQQHDPATNYEDLDNYAQAVVYINQAQASFFTKITEVLIKQSRKPCHLCEQLADENHICPRLN